jgi:hypothetical protein
MPGSHPLNYEPYPGVNPTGAPGDDYLRIQADPNAFGLSVAKGQEALGRGEEALGQGIEHAGNVGLEAATARQNLQNEVHATSVNTWLNNKITDRWSKFSLLQGRAALDGLPQYKKDIEDLYNQAQTQIPSLQEQAQFARSGRYQIDAYYKYGTNHADGQFRTWANRTAQDEAASFANMAGIAALHGDDHGMQTALNASDNGVKKLWEQGGYDATTIGQEVAKNRGKNLKYIIESRAKAGGEGGAPDPQGAAALYAQYRDQMDPASRLAVESTLKPLLHQSTAQAIGSMAMGRPADHGVFRDAEQNGFIPAGYVSKLFHLESGGDPNAVTGSNKGLGQFGPREETRYGINDANRADPIVQTRAVLAEAAANRIPLSSVLGRNPNAGELYLAHQQGIGGAIAQLTHPDAPAWQNMASTKEGREKGDAWAKQAIWGNMTPQMRALFPDGVESVKGSDFVALWNARFNGTVPPAPLPDKGQVFARVQAMTAANPELQRSALAYVNQQYSIYNTETSVERQTLQQNVPQFIKAAEMGVEGVTIPEERIRAVMPPAVAEKWVNEFAIAQRVGEVMRSMRWATPQEIAAAQHDIESGQGVLSEQMRGHAKGAASGPGAAGAEGEGGEGMYFNLRLGASHQLENLINRRTQMLTGANADPAAYVRAAPTVAASTKALDPQKPETFAAYATASLAVQDQLGVPRDKQRILTNDAAAALAARWSNPDQAGGATVVMKEIEQQAALWGDRWPEVYRQIAPKANAMIRVIGAGVQPEAARELLETQHVAIGDLEKSAADPNEHHKDIVEKVSAALKPFAATISGSERAQTLTDFRNVAERLTAARLAKTPGNVEAAATQAVKDLLDFKYQYRDTYRIPLRPDLDADTVQAGAVEARRLLGDPAAAGGALALAPKADAAGRGLSPEHLTRETAEGLRHDGVWLTEPHERGIVLVQSDGYFARRADGSPLMLTWQQLHDLGSTVKKTRTETQPMLQAGATAR